MGVQKKLCDKMDGVRTGNKSVFMATIEHIRDLEEYQKQKRNEIDDLSEEQEHHKETKDEEMRHLMLEKYTFNQRVEVKKEKIFKDIAEIDSKIQNLVISLKNLNKNLDIENALSKTEVTVEKLTQGLKTVV